MDFLVGVLAVLVLGPLLGIATVAADARAGGRPLTDGRLVRAAAWSGAILAAPLGCVVAIAPEGNLPALPISLVVGGAYGALIGGLTLALRWAWRRQRDGAA